MIKMPDDRRMFEYETYYHLTLDVGRLAKFIAHYDSFKKTLGIPGAIVECGVFKGTSFSRFAVLRELLSNHTAKKLVAFDVFGDDFPDTAYEEDKEARKQWIETAGGSSISTEQLSSLFDRRNIKNYDLVEGDVLETVPRYVSEHPEFKISLLNIDIDFYESTTVVLEHLYDRVMPGGVILLDNYQATHGDTVSVDDFFRTRDGVTIHAFPFADRPCYIVKQ